MLERACAAQVATLSCGRELVLPPHEVCEHTAEQFAQQGRAGAARVGCGPSALRLIEGEKPDYRS